MIKTKRKEKVFTQKMQVKIKGVGKKNIEVKEDKWEEGEKKYQPELKKFKAL